MMNEEHEPRNEDGFSEKTINSDVRPNISEDDLLIDLGEDYDFDDFEVVRREFFAHMNEPAATFKDCKFYVNSACFKKFPETRFVQALVNKRTKVLALLPCSEYARDSFQWCSESKGKRKPKHITCKLFFAKIVAMMGWNPDYRYKLLGKLVRANEMYLLAFDLNSPEAYPKTFVEGEKPKVSRKPVYPEGWQNQFGLPYSEHRQSLQINIFDGYAVYAIKDNQLVDKTDSNPDAVPKEDDSQ